MINRVWKLLQYYASYKIWLPRNSEIFKNLSSTPCKSSTKYWGLLCEQFVMMDWETKFHLNRIQRKGIGLGNVTNRLRKDCEIKWTIESKKSFNDIKKAIAEAPVLVCPDFSKDYCFLFCF